MHTATLVLQQLKKKANYHCKQKPAVNGGQVRNVRPRHAPSDALCHIQPPAECNAGASRAIACIYLVAPFASQCHQCCIIGVRREDDRRLLHVQTFCLSLVENLS